MKRKFFSTLLILFFTLGIVAQEPVAGFLTGTPQDAGISPERLQRLDDLIGKYIDEGKIPGGVFLVARYGQLVYYKSAGYRSADKKEMYQKDDIFRIASMTKAVTSVAVMQLYEQGLLGLDDPVYKYIPAFKETQVLDTFNEADSSYTTVPAQTPVTIRHLLTHTSGITYGDFNPGKLMAVYKKNGMLGVGLSHNSWTTEEFINRLAKVPLAFQPGERFLYGLNMDVLGRVVEVVSGEKLADYFRNHIFEPLGMTDTWFYLPKEKQPRLVPVYSFKQDGSLAMASQNNLAPGLDYPQKADNHHYAGGGGLSSTAPDYARFIQALLNQGALNGNRILGRKTIETMTSDQLIRLNAEGKGISRRPGESFCLGFGLLTAAGEGISSKSAGTYEWAGYFNTKFFIDPHESLIFVGMTQVSPFPHGEFWDRLTAAIYGAIED